MVAAVACLEAVSSARVLSATPARCVRHWSTIANPIHAPITAHAAALLVDM